MGEFIAHITRKSVRNIIESWALVFEELESVKIGDTEHAVKSDHHVDPCRHLSEYAVEIEDEHTA